MEQYIIKGGNPLVGEVVIGGAKNAALPVLAAAVMTDGKCMIDNMPDVRDINVLLQAMQEIGADIDRTGKHEVTISGKGIHPECDVDNEFIRKIRASYYLIGALLGKYKRARVALPGGCEIGSRPIDQHIGSEDPWSRNRCDPYQRCGKIRRLPVFHHSRPDRSRNIYDSSSCN